MNIFISLKMNNSSTIIIELKETIDTLKLGVAKLAH